MPRKPVPCRAFQFGRHAEVTATVATRKARPVVECFGVSSQSRSARMSCRLHQPCEGDLRTLHIEVAVVRIANEAKGEPSERFRPGMRLGPSLDVANGCLAHV